MNSVQKKVTWHSPKQVGIMIFTGFMLLAQSSLVGGQTNTVLPAISAARGWGLNTLLVWAGITNWFVAVGNIFFSATMPKLRPRITMAITLAVTAILLVIFGMTENLTVFIICMLLMAFVCGGYSMSGAMTLTSNWWPTKKGVVLGWTTMGIVLMNIVYVPFMPAAYASFGILGTQIGLAVIIALSAVVCMLFIKNTPEEANTFPDGNAEFVSGSVNIVKEMAEYKSPFTTAKVLKLGSTWTVSIAFFLLYVTALSFIGSAIPAFISYGHDFSTAAAVFAFGGIAALFGSWLWGFIDLKVGTKKSSIVFAVIFFIGITFGILAKSSIIFVWASTIVLMGCNGGLCNLIPSYVGTLYGRWDYYAGYKVIGSIAQLGAGVGFICIGLFPSFQSMYIFDLVIIVIAFVLLRITNDKFIGKAG
jgi:sugar phosphate permease